MKALVLFLAATTIFCTVAFGQTPTADQPKIVAVDPDPERQKLLVDEILANIEGLRRSENRSYVLAKIGAIRCTDDPKGAAELLQRSINELVSAKMEADQRRDQPDTANLLIPIRTLGIIATCDAELALRNLERTGISRVERSYSPGSSGMVVNGVSFSTGAFGDPSDAALEQRFTFLAAEQNPARDPKLLQEQIKRTLSQDTLQLLKRLFDKNPDLANSLAADSMGRLLAAKFAPEGDQSALTLATAILQDFLRPVKVGTTALKFDESAVRSLATKVFDYLLSIDPRSAASRVSPLMNVAERLSPGSLPALKKIELSKYPPGYAGPVMTYDTQKLLQERSATPSQLLAEAAKMPTASRAPLIQLAANRMAEADEYNSAVEVLTANFTSKALENAIESLKWWYCGHLINRARWAEAEAVIDGMIPSNQRSAYILLAGKAFQGDPVKNKELARSVLGKARGLLPEKPADQTELNQLMQLATAYAGISASDGLRIVEDLMPVANDLMDAFATVQTFQHFPGVRIGEFTIGENFGIRLDPSTFRRLSAEELERTVRCLNLIARREVRVSILLALADPTGH